MKNFEKENLSEAKKRLLELEANGGYLFHGSPTSDIKEFEPRQSYTYTEDDVRVPDGPPSVSASPYTDIAIFRSITSHKNIKNKDGFKSGFGSTVNPTGVTLHFRLPSWVLENMRDDARGYVYVFDRKNFVPRNEETGMEWWSENSVRPIEVIEVHKEDLPKNIDSIE